MAGSAFYRVVITQCATLRKFVGQNHGCQRSLVGVLTTKASVGMRMAQAAMRELGNEAEALWAHCLLCEYGNNGRQAALQQRCRQLRGTEVNRLS